MAKLPPVPPVWKNKAAGAPQKTPPVESELSMGPGGLLDGWRQPGWSLENSGPGVLLPEMVAQAGGPFGAVLKEMGSPITMPNHSRSGYFAPTSTTSQTIQWAVPVNKLGKH